MSRFVSPELTGKVQAVMFGDNFKTPEERFLQVELARYVPQLVGKTDQEVTAFMQYQWDVYIAGKLPVIGTPIASLNPTFVDSLDLIQVHQTGRQVYTRASIKENGYRAQIHADVSSLSSFTRQFTRYDWHMFPELWELRDKLPVMIGDAELVNKRHKHLAGFNRVKLRIPNQTYWPKPGQEHIDSKLLGQYLADQTLFDGVVSLPDTELTLAFHGLFAIAHPDTWGKDRHQQLESMISLCKLPIDYKEIDRLLDLLGEYFLKHNLNARVVERFVPKTHKELAVYVESNDEKGLEGTCVVQSLRDEQGIPVVGGRSIKIKKYENLDCALLGLYLRDKEEGLLTDNITGAMVGLYDPVLGVYLPAAKVNLDPNGVQIKTNGQRERLTGLRAELASLVTDGHVVEDDKIYTLYDAFLLEGALLIKYLFNGKSPGFSVDKVLADLPVRSDLVSLFELYAGAKERVLLQSYGHCISKKKAKPATVAEKFLFANEAFFKAINSLDPAKQKRFIDYFSKVKKIREVSAKLVKPQVLVDTRNPIILETQVFDLSWDTSPFAAGFHSWFCNSFRFNNVFAEQVRNDKKTTTDFATIHGIARKNTVRKKKN